MAREARTVDAMIELYCREVHGSAAGLGSSCAGLRDYARQRLKKCPFQEGKTTCARCPVHCYRPEMRRRIRAVMRYAGPRMLLRRPRLALLHLVDGLRRLPAPTRAPEQHARAGICLLYTSPSPRDRTRSRMPSSA